MRIEKAAELLLNEFDAKFKEGTMTVGHNQTDKIYVYVHIRGIKKDEQIKKFEGYNVVYEFIGKVKPAKAAK